MKHFFLSMVLLFAGLNIAIAQEPNLAIIPAPRDNVGHVKKHIAIKEAAKKIRPDILFLGDSITQGWEGKKAWKELMEPLNAFNAGISGDRTEHILWRIQDGGINFAAAPKLCILMIGTNNTGARKGSESAEYTADGVKKIIQVLNKKYPKMKILLLAIFPRGAKADDKLRLLNDQINEELMKIKHPLITFLDIKGAFLEADGTLPRALFPDLLHPNDAGYYKYSEAILPTVKKLLNKK